MRRPKLRDLSRLKTNELFPINDIPKDVIVKIGGYLIYLLYIGRTDISGDDWSDAFAYAIGGENLSSPIGIADVVFQKMAWSMKTVKSNNPFSARSVRLISGRCSPDYSYGITDPHKNIQETGRAVLGIWNERINIAQDSYNPVRTSILVRSADLLSYCLFEEENHRYRTNDYIWEVNRNGNLEGKDVATGEVRFTWQPHGSQFTIHTKIPSSAVRFEIKRPPIISKSAIWEAINFNESWVKIL